MLRAAVIIGEISAFGITFMILFSHIKGCIVSIRLQAREVRHRDPEPIARYGLLVLQSKSGIPDEECKEAIVAANVTWHPLIDMVIGTQLGVTC